MDTRSSGEGVVDGDVEEQEAPLSPLPGLVYLSPAENCFRSEFPPFSTRCMGPKMICPNAQDNTNMNITPASIDAYDVSGWRGVFQLCSRYSAAGARTVRGMIGSRINLAIA